MKPTSDGKRRVIVFVVCGGFKIDLVDVESYRVHLEKTDGIPRVAQVNGRSAPL
jgi:hypothetical protein